MFTTMLQEESTSLDVMYNEQADLLENLDIQIHELYQYYSLRPHLHTEHSCDQVGFLLRAVNFKARD